MTKGCPIMMVLPFLGLFFLFSCLFCRRAIFGPNIPNASQSQLEDVHRRRVFTDIEKRELVKKMPSQIQGLHRERTLTATGKRKLAMDLRVVYTDTGPTESPTVPELALSWPESSSLSGSPETITTFCVVADAPYHSSENEKLLDHIENLDSECEFVTHLGDIRSARLFDTCVQETYTNASLIMQRSQKPVFMILGDNEWNDCPNHEEALGFWHDEFDNFVHRWPDHGFAISSHPDRIENMYFIHKQTLFITLNIVGGRVVDQTEWDDRLTTNFQWVKYLIDIHVRLTREANVVVLMAHATNSPNHRLFFHSMQDYIDYELDNTIPILYLNGDVHSFNEQPNFFEQESWLRITLAGNAKDKPLKVRVDASDHVRTVDEAFSYVRYY